MIAKFGRRRGQHQQLHSTSPQQRSVKQGSGTVGLRITIQSKGYGMKGSGFSQTTKLRASSAWAQDVKQGGQRRLFSPS